MDAVKLYAKTWRWLLLIAGITMIAVVLVHPVNRTAYKLAGLLGVFLVWLSFLIQCRKRSTPSVILLALPVLVTLFLVIPTRNQNSDALKREYLAELRKFAGTRYIYGGESSLGIDCSGLPRVALRNAQCRRFWATGNPVHARAWLKSWWFDSSASALSQGYRNFTWATGIHGVLKEIDTAHLEPGDCAITENGVHLLVYLGNDEWIQADPSTGNVHIANPKNVNNPWFNSSVTLHQWRELNE